MYTFDTNPIIYYLKDEPSVVPVLGEILTTEEPVYISTLSELELFSYSALAPEDIEQIEDFLAALVIVNVDSRVARVAGRLRQEHAGLKTPDSVIAATALLTHTTLVTRNVKDFQQIATLRLLEI